MAVDKATLEKMQRDIHFILIEEWSKLPGGEKTITEDTIFLSSTTATPVKTYSDLVKEFENKKQGIAIFARKEYPEVFKRMSLQEAGNWAVRKCFEERGRVNLTIMESLLNNLDMDYSYL